MERTAYQKLLNWKENTPRRPLIVTGANHTGKTALLRRFGENCYRQAVSIDFRKNENARALFNRIADPRRLVSEMERQTGLRLEDGTLLIFDEVQACARALASLKYFPKEVPGLDIVCAGRLPVVSHMIASRLPRGSVDLLELQPLDFCEFLEATGREALAAPLRADDPAAAMPDSPLYEKALREYLFVGGLPDVVEAFAQRGDFAEVRRMQLAILQKEDELLEEDAPEALRARIRLIRRSMPAQLARKDNKFRYELVREGTRARDCEAALLWMREAGQVLLCPRLREPAAPIAEHADPRGFVLYLSDVGLLSCLLDLSPDAPVYGPGENAPAVQFAFGELARRGLSPGSWSARRATSAIDLIAEADGRIVPVDVRSGADPQAKSLRVFRERFAPKLAVRTSLSELSEEHGLLTLPLWAIRTLPSFLALRTEQGAAEPVR